MKILAFLFALLLWENPQDQKNTALLRTVPQIADLTQRIPALAASGDYEKALDIFGPLLKKFPNHTVPVSATLSVGVRTFLTKELSTWPPEGITAYRKRYDSLLREKYERAQQTQDLTLLSQITAHHPFSSVAIDAALLHSDFLLDRGSPEKAARLLEPLIERDTEIPSGVIAAKLGLALSRTGEAKTLRTLLEMSKRKWPETAIYIGNKKVFLIDYLKTLLLHPDPKTRTKHPSLLIPEWPLMGGAADGNGTAEPNVSLGQLAWQLSVSPATYEFSTRSRFRFPQQSQDYFLPFYPAISDGIVYVHNEYSVYALPLFSKGVDVLWSFRLPTPPGTLMFDDRVIHTTSVQNGRVYVNLITKLGQAEERLGYVRVKFPFPSRTLFALDAYTGKEIWRKGGGKGEYSFPTPPTPDGDRLYVGGVKQDNTTDPFEHYLVCLDRTSGKILWETFIASGLTEINLFGNSTRESFGSPVAIQGDFLYYTTNHGVFVSLNKNNGQLQWVYRYRQLPVRPTRSIQISHNPLEWINGPPVVADERVVFTPTDSRYLHVLDSQTGRENWTVRRRSDVRVLYGVQNKTVIVGGETLGFYDLRTGQLLDTFHPRSPGRGRGVLAPGEIYMPTRTGLHRINLSTRTSSQFTRWKGSRSKGGNLVIVDGAVILAGTKALETCFDRRSFEKEAEAILAQNPDHIGILYRSAVRYAQSGKDEKALSLFQKVFEKGSSSRKPEESQLLSACQLRLYRLHLNLGSKAVSRKNLSEGEAHFQKAIIFASDVQSRLKATTHLAELFESTGDPAKAVLCFARLLPSCTDRALHRTVRKKIARIVKENGRDCYLSIEERAEKYYAQARQEGTPEALLQTTTLYPNSLAAQKAILEAIELYKSTGRERDQGKALRAFLREYPESEVSPQIHVALILFLEKRKQYSSALSLLSRLGRLWPDRSVLVEGRKIPARSFVKLRMALEIYQNTERGVRNVPLETPLSLALRHKEKRAGAGVLIQPGGARPESVRDHTFLRYRKSLVALQLNGERWALSLDNPLLFSHFHEQELLLGTSSSLFRIDPKTGKKLWSFSSQAPMREFSLIGSHICFFTSDYKINNSNIMMAVNVVEGDISWQQVFTGDPSSGIHRAGDLALFVTRYPPVLFAYDSETGTPVLKKKLSSGGVLRKIFQAKPQQVILYSPHRFLEAWSLSEEKRLWRVNLDLFSSPFPVASGKTIHIFAQRQGRNITLAARVDTKTGKFDRLVEKPFLGNIQYAEAGRDLLYIVSLDRKNRKLLISGINPDTLVTHWTVRYPDSEGTPLPPTVSGDHLVFVRFSRGSNGTFSYKMTLLDRAGNPVQNISSPFQYQRPPSYIVEEGRVALTIDAEVHVYK